MKIRKYLLAILLIAGFWGCSMNSGGQAQDLIDWTNNLDAAKATALSENKPVLIDFYAEWCGWCKRMDADTYSDKKVAELAKSFVCVKINSDENAKLANTYQVRGLPTTVFLKPDGSVISVMPGYQPPDQFLGSMNRALESR